MKATKLALTRSGICTSMLVMSLTYLELKQKLSAWHPQILSSLDFDHQIEWQIPTDPSHGLWTTNIAFVLAKTLRQNPQEIATKLIAELELFLKESELPLLAVQAGNYINLKLSSKALSEMVAAKNFSLQLENIFTTESKIVLLDYVSPNVAKPLHAGHIRNVNLGESLRRILSLKYKVITECFWGDWGVQFGVLLWAWKKFLQLGSLEVTINGQLETVTTADIESNPIDTMVRVYVWGNQQKDLVEGWDDIVRQEFLALEKGDQENRELWGMFLEASKESVRTELAILNLPPFDLEQGESFYESEFVELSEFLESQGLWQAQGLARYLDLEAVANDWPELSEVEQKQIKSYGRCYLMSSTGYSSYALRDMAARISWIKNVGADIMITVTGNEQKHHFHQVFSLLQYYSTKPVFQSKYTPELSSKLNKQSLIHIPYGFMTLPEGKMSTRKGNILTAGDLLQQIINQAKSVILAKRPETLDVDDRARVIGVAALKWFDLNRDSSNDIVLDIPKILQFEGNTGVYQLYTYARLKSVLRKAEQNNVDQNTISVENVSNLDLLTPEELLILQQMYLLPETLQKSIDSYKPHLLCNHLYTLSDKVNNWYNQTSVLKEPDTLRLAVLLSFVKQFCDHIEFVLDLLGIEVLEEI